MKILVVDDSKTMRKIVRNALEGMGYSSQSITEASDGLEAIQKLRECRGRIDIILADWNMPNMDGLSLLKQLQGIDQLSQIPMIMVTGEAQRDRVVEAIKHGARNYIVKPFTPETLRQKVLAIEMELLAKRKPTDTAVMRMEAAKAGEANGGEMPFLAQLPEELVAGIYECAARSEHRRGQVLIETGDTVQSLHVVDRGEVEIVSCFSPSSRWRSSMTGRSRRPAGRASASGSSHSSRATRRATPSARGPTSRWPPWRRATSRISSRSIRTSAST